MTCQLYRILVLGTIVACLAGAAAVAPARADLRPPTDDPPPKKQRATAPVEVLSIKGQRYRIVLPRRVVQSALNQLGAAAPSRRDESSRRQRTLFAGLAMSAALASLVGVRKKSTVFKAVAMLAFGGVVYAASQWAYADLGPRPLGPIRKPAEIEVLIQEQGRKVQLFLPVGRGPAARGEGAAPPPEAPTDESRPAPEPAARRAPK